MSRRSRRWWPFASACSLRDLRSTIPHTWTSAPTAWPDFWRMARAVPARCSRGWAGLRCGSKLYSQSGCSPSSCLRRVWFSPAGESNGNPPLPHRCLCDCACLPSLLAAGAAFTAPRGHGHSGDWRRHLALHVVGPGLAIYLSVFLQFGPVQPGIMFLPPAIMFRRFASKLGRPVTKGREQDER